MHPAAARGGYRFEDTTIGEAIPKRFMTSVDSGIRESMVSGALNGYPVVDVRVEVYDGSYHDTDSTDAAFRTAGAMAFQEAASRAQPLVIEPVMQVVVKAETRHVRRVLEGFPMRRGELRSRTPEPAYEVITAHVPLSELFGFEGQLRAETYGHASCSIQFAYYAPVAHGPAGDDEYGSHVGAPRKPAPQTRTDGASVPEPDDSSADNAWASRIEDAPLGPADLVSTRGFCIQPEATRIHRTSSPASCTPHVLLINAEKRSKVIDMIFRSK